MYKLGETLQKDGFLELRQEGDLYLLSIGDCFDDGGEGVCMPLFSFTKKLSRGAGRGTHQVLRTKYLTRLKNFYSKYPFPSQPQGWDLRQGRGCFFGVR